MAILFNPGNDLNKWSGVESVDRSARLTIAPAPLKQDSQALRVVVKPTDLIQNGVRNEVVWDSKESEGNERWYTWSTFFPEGFPAPEGKWQVWAQWHQSYRQDGTTLGSSPPVEFALYGDELRLNTNGVQPGTAKTWWRTKLERGKWIDVLFHVKWSSNPAVGFIELRINGSLVLARSQVATLFPGLTNYFKLGLYRHREIAEEAVIYHQGFKAGTTRADVSPPVTLNAPESKPIKLLIQGADGKRYVVTVTPES